MQAQSRERADRRAGGVAAQAGTVGLCVARDGSHASTQEVLEGPWWVHDDGRVVDDAALVRRERLRDTATSSAMAGGSDATGGAPVADSAITPRPNRPVRTCGSCSQTS